MKSYDKILASSIFRLNGANIDLCEILIELVNEIEEIESSDWTYYGEFNECTASDLLIGAYWALTESHGGQNSIEYAALCAIGSIYSPNMASGPEPESGEGTAYEMIDIYFKEKFDK